VSDTETVQALATTQVVVKPFKLPKPEPDILPVNPQMVTEYIAWFVNRRAFCRQSDEPGEGGKHYWYRPQHPDIRKWAYTEAKKRTSPGDKPDRNLVKELYHQRVANLNLQSEFVSIDTTQIAKHLAGEITINLYAINPETQRCKWVAIDADYDRDRACRDLYTLKYDLQEDGVEAVVERSRRGAHLWIFCQTPLPAKQCRIFIYNLAQRLDVPIKGSGFQAEGIEIFPRQDSLDPGEMGNALRGPLGVHRATMARYWFEEPAGTLQAQVDYLRSVKRLTAQQLEDLTAGMSIPDTFEVQPEPVRRAPYIPSRRLSDPPMVKELEAYRKSVRHKKMGRNWVMQCPSCAAIGRDRGRDNFAIKIDEPHKYLCWAGCTKKMIRAALGVPESRGLCDRFS
jgi:hypothetical protein